MTLKKYSCLCKKFFHRKNDFINHLKSHKDKNWVMDNRYNLYNITNNQIPIIYRENSVYKYNDCNYCDFRNNTKYIKNKKCTIVGCNCGCDVCYVCNNKIEYIKERPITSDYGCGEVLNKFRDKYACLKCKIIIKSKDFVSKTISDPNPDFKGQRCYKCGENAEPVNYAFSFEAMDKLKKNKLDGKTFTIA
jgi:hypothetical protein